MARTKLHTHTTTWTRQEQFHGHDLETECTVSFTVCGKHQPMRWGPDGGSPEEFPDVDIESVIVTATGEDITDDLTSEEEAEVQALAEIEDDGDDDDRAYEDARDRAMEG